MSPKKKESTKEEIESSESTDSWYEIATPTGEYLPKLEGINYYELLDSGKLKESKIEDRDVQNVEFEAIHLETTNIRGKVVEESPSQPVEGILSLPLSAARKIRSYMEENSIKLEDMIGMVLALQKTGSQLKTRYPSVELLKKEDYNA